MKKLMYLFATSVVLIACKKDDPIVPAGKYDNGILVLNEGLFQQNNASVSFYDFTDNSVDQQIFSVQNNRGLGDLANDWESYSIGDSSYVIIAVDQSSQLEIVNARTFKSVAQIPVFNGTIGRQPRQVRVVGEKAYSINYDGTVSVVDLNSHAITNTITVGANPDGMEIIGNYLYVANSGGLNWPDYDSTISVVNLISESEELQFESAVNCGPMIADSEGDIYVLSRGNYGSIAPSMLRVDSQSNTVVDEYNVSIGSWTLNGEYIYYYDSNLQGVYRFNTLTETFENTQLIDCSSYTTMYAIHMTDVLMLTCDVEGYTNSSTVRVYDHAGVLQYSFTAGFIAKDVLF